MASIIERSNKLLHLISVIRAALLEIVRITTPNAAKLQTTGLHPFLPLPLSARSAVESTSGSSMAERRSAYDSNKSTPLRSGYASGMHSAQHTSSAGTMVLRFTPTHDSMGQLEPAVEAAMVHFCELTFSAVNEMVFSSHDLFVDTLWSRSSQHSSSSALLGEEQQERRASRVVSFNVPDSPEKVESLAEVLKQDGELQARMGSLVESLRAKLVCNCYVTAMWYLISVEVIHSVADPEGFHRFPS